VIMAIMVGCFVSIRNKTIKVKSKNATTGPTCSEKLPITALKLG